jgi:hypothetical protein
VNKNQLLNNKTKKKRLLYLQRGAVEIHSPMCFWIVAVGTPLGSTIAAKVSLSLVKKMMYRLYKVHLVKHWN